MVNEQQRNWIIGAIIVIVIVLLGWYFLKPASAHADNPCDPYAPYYHKVETGPGALLADLFFFGMSAPVAVAVVGGRSRPVVNTQTRERVRVPTALCLPVSTAKHFFQNRPPHAEHWVTE